VRVNGERLHAFSEGVMVQQGTAVEVVSVRGTRVMVREVGDRVETPPAEDDLLADSDARPAPAPLDFDVPQG
jgi:hypothetical protein